MTAADVKQFKTILKEELKGFATKEDLLSMEKRIIGDVGNLVADLLIPQLDEKVEIQEFEKLKSHLRSV